MYTHKSHLKIEFLSPDSNYAPLTPYMVSTGELKNRPKRPIEEAIKAARLIYEHSGRRKIFVAMSGGIDSEAVAYSFLRAGIPFEAVILRFERGLNDFDIRYAIEYCQTNGIKHHFVDLDIANFYLNGDHLAYCQKYRVISPQLVAHLYLLDQLHGELPILSWNPSIGLNDNFEVCPALPSDLFFCYHRYFELNASAGVAFFFLYTPELAYSFFSLEGYSCVAHKRFQLIYGEDSLYKLKCRLYLEGGFEVTPKPNKYTGFEQVKFFFKDYYQGTLDSFNEHFRRPLEKLFPTSSSYVSHLPSYQSYINSLGIC